MHVGVRLPAVDEHGGRVRERIDPVADQELRVGAFDLEQDMAVSDGRDGPANGPCRAEPPCRKHHERCAGPSDIRTLPPTRRARRARRLRRRRSMMAARSTSRSPCTRMRLKSELRRIDGHVASRPIFAPIPSCRWVQLGALARRQTTSSRSAWKRVATAHSISSGCGCRRPCPPR